MKQIFATFAAVLFFAFAAWADPSGSYEVKGVELDGTEYSGTLDIAKTGDVYELSYALEDGVRQKGSAVGDDTFLAYGYADDEELGVGLMNAKGEGVWEGIWTRVGATKVSIETWTKK